MKFSLSLMLLAGLILASCSTNMDEPPQRVRQRPAKYPEQGQAQPAPGQQPFNPNAPPSPENAPTQENAPLPVKKVAKGDYPYGIPIPGEPGFVYSPYSPGKKIDVRGFAPGQEVKDPYITNEAKIFLVP